MGYWSYESGRDGNALIDEAWARWEATWFRDEFERHLVMADMDIRLPETPQEILQRQAIEYLRENFEKESTNLAAELAKELGGVASEATESARGSVHEDAKMAIIEALEKRIPVGTGRA